jgi:hypothetical protein
MHRVISPTVNSPYSRKQAVFLAPNGPLGSKRTYGCSWARANALSLGTGTNLLSGSSINVLRRRIIPHTCALMCAHVCLARSSGTRLSNRVSSPLSYLLLVPASQRREDRREHPLPSPTILTVLKLIGPFAFLRERTRETLPRCNYGPDEIASKRESLRFFISCARLQASICKFPGLADASVFLPFRYRQILRGAKIDAEMHQSDD